MIHNTRADASRHAQDMADTCGYAWAFFTDHTGTHRAEPAKDLTGTANVRCQREWSVQGWILWAVIVQPEETAAQHQAARLDQDCAR